MLPSAEIACGILQRQGRLLVARRRRGSHLEGAWEFPGGKVEAGETPEDALRREVHEETGLAVADAFLLHVEPYDYPDRRVILHFFLCPEPHGTPSPKASTSIRWVSLSELRSLRVPPANRGVLRLLEEQYGGDDAPPLF